MILASGEIGKRCQKHERDEQCRLPLHHRCRCVFIGEPISLTLCLAWRAEVEAAEQAAAAAYGYEV
jgi:hypothetical protein